MLPYTARLSITKRTVRKTAVAPVALILHSQLHNQCGLPPRASFVMAKQLPGEQRLFSQQSGEVWYMQSLCTVNLSHRRTDDGEIRNQNCRFSAEFPFCQFSGCPVNYLLLIPSSLLRCFFHWDGLGPNHRVRGLWSHQFPSSVAVSIALLIYVSADAILPIEFAWLFVDVPWRREGQSNIERMDRQR